ncbi:MAG TPA: hypothetical protein VF669_05610 [Tepidisphaeraceae bacterium]|jgi:hypothetical protein
MEEDDPKSALLDYADPEANRRPPLLRIGRGASVFVAACTAMMTWYGVWYLQQWWLSSQFPPTWYPDDLPLGLFAIATGVTLFWLAVRMFHKKSRHPS